MKSTSIQFATALILGTATFFMACKKEAEIYQPEIRNFEDKAFIKVYNSTVNSTRNYVYVDDVPVTGQGITYATSPLFPAVSYYSAIPAGNRSILIKDTLLTTLQKPLTFSSNFDAGANYTIFTYDTLTNTKYKVVKDNIQEVPDTTSRLRFANMIYSKTAVPNVDVYSVKLKQNLFSNIAVEAVTDYVNYQSGLTDTLYVRSTGQTTNLATAIWSTPTQKRSYTIVYRGHAQTTTGTLARVLSMFNNY